MVNLAKDMFSLRMHHRRHERFIESWVAEFGGKAIAPLDHVIPLLIMHGGMDVICHIFIKGPHTVPLEAK